MLSLLIKIFCSGWPGGWVGGWVAGSAENKAQLSSTAVAVEVEIEAELFKNIKKKKLTFDDKWDRPKNKPNPIEKRKLMGIAIEKLIVTSMKNHIYSYNGVKRIQCNSK